MELLCDFDSCSEFIVRQIEMFLYKNTLLVNNLSSQLVFKTENTEHCRAKIYPELPPCWHHKLFSNGFLGTNSMEVLQISSQASLSV